MAKNILRWVSVLPVGILVFIITKIVYDWSFSHAIPEVIYEVSISRDFSGHYILGPIYIVCKESIATFFAIIAACQLAPCYKQKVFFGLMGLWVLVLFATVFMAGVIFEHNGIDKPEQIIRTFIEIASQCLGFVYSFKIGKDDNWTFSFPPRNN